MSEVLLTILLLSTCTVWFLWVNRKGMWINPAVHLTVFVYIIPFVLVPFLDRYTPLRLVFYRRRPYTIQEDVLTACLFLALLSYICFVVGYLATAKCRLLKGSVFPTHLTFGKIHSWVLLLFCLGFFLHVFGIYASYGIKQYFTYFAQIRGDPAFADIKQNSMAFLIHLGRIMLFVPAYLWFGQYAAARKHGTLALMGVSCLFAALITAGGRAGVLSFFIILILTWYGSRQERPSVMIAVLFLGFAVIIIIAGRVILNSQAYVHGLAGLSGSVQSKMVDLGHVLERFSPFGQHILHLSFVYQDVGTRYEYYMFRDVAVAPLYVIPKLIHGIDVPAAQVAFNDIYYHETVQFGNNPPGILAYFYWSSGVPGIIFGSCSLGCLAAIAKAWCRRTAMLPGFYGLAVFVAYSSTFVARGYMSYVTKMLFPPAMVIAVLLFASRLRTVPRARRLATPAGV